MTVPSSPRGDRTLRRGLLALTIWALGIALAAPPAAAGGQMEDLVILGPTSHPDFYAAELTPVRWDERCMPLHFTLNTSVLPLAEPPLDAEATRDALQQAFEVWNVIPTSYIEMHITGERQRPGPRAGVFDFVNEINFLTDDPSSGIASVGLVTTALDTEFMPGDDIDGDGDSDFYDPAVVGHEHCFDVDGDGDVEFSAGFYPAATILEADATFNNGRGIVWTTDLGAVGYPVVDLIGTAVHEFGHALGLSHTLVDQIGRDAGRGAVMVGHATLDDPEDLRTWRTLAADDVAWSSFVYPEGSAETGPAALGPGDVAFRSVYGVIRGEITHGGSGQPLLGGHIYAVDRDSGEVAASHYTGRGRLFWAPFLGQLHIEEELPSFHLAAGTYTLPVPAGTYHLVIEAMDGLPKAGADFMALSSPLVGDFFASLDFNEEYLLAAPGEHEPLEVEVEAGAEVVGIDHTTSVDWNLDPFDLVGGGPGGVDDGGFFWAPPGTFYAVRIPAAEMAAFLDRGLPRAIAYLMGVIDTSVAPLFPRAALVAGRADGDGAVLDLAHPLAQEVDFLGQELDFAPLYFAEPGDLAERLREAMAADETTDFFMVLELPEIFDGIHGLPPVIGLDVGQEAGLLGRSYVSLDGGATFFR